MSVRSGSDEVVNFKVVPSCGSVEARALFSSFEAKKISICSCFTSKEVCLAVGSDTTFSQ